MSLTQPTLSVVNFIETSDKKQRSYHSLSLYQEYQAVTTTNSMILATANILSVPHFSSEQWILPSRFTETEILMGKLEDNICGTQIVLNHCGKLNILL